jgi:hypothetical protein
MSMRGLTLTIVLALVAEAWSAPWDTSTPAPEKSFWKQLKDQTEKLDVSWPPSTAVKADFASSLDSGTLSKPTGTLSANWGSVAGGVNIALNSTAHWPSKRTNRITLEKKIGSVCCKLTSDAEWPPKPTASFRGNVDLQDAGTICYDLKTPVNSVSNGELDLSGTISLEKKIGSSLCTLETPPVWPPEASASIRHTFKDAGKLCCTLKTAIHEGATPSATVQRTFETDLGEVCCKAEADLVTSGFEPSGSVTLKKKIGGICANLEAKTGGGIRCTLNSAWDGVLAQRLPFFFTRLPIGALIGTFAGLTFAVLRFRPSGAAVTAPEGSDGGYSSLLAA